MEVFRSVCGREERAMRAAAAADARRGVGRRSGSRRCWRRSPQRALRNPRLAWALIAEPVDPLVDAERLAYRERYAALIAEQLRAGIAAGELPEQNVELTAAALVGGCGEALVGPLSPVARRRPSGRRDRRGAADVRTPGGRRRER